MIIDYIFILWSEDRSFSGTVKPMKWLNMYFDFLLPEHYPNLFDILDEYTSAYPSYDAKIYTSGIISKITVDIISHIENEFVDYVANKVLITGLKDIGFLFDLTDSYLDSGKCTNSNYIEKLKLVSKLGKAKKESNKKNYNETYGKLQELTCGAVW